MLARCPECQKDTEIADATLEKRHGEVRCAHCGNQFNALGDHEQDDEFSWLDSCLTEPIDSSILDERSSLHSSRLSEPRLGEASGPVDRGSQPSSLLSGLPDIIPSRREAISVDDALAVHVPGWLKRLGLVLLGLLLLYTLLFQLLWFNREEAVKHPKTRWLLNQMCAPFGCKAPPRQDTRLIRVLLSDVKNIDKPVKSLLISLTLGNAADFDQPYPRIDVALLDTEEHVVGKRTFEPKEYLLPGTSPDSLFHAHSIRDASILLVDPGPRAVGYRFEFH